MNSDKHHVFTCCLVNGLHARPATRLVGVTKEFSANITLTNERNGEQVNAKSILAVVSADVQHNDSVRIEASGPDRELAIQAIRDFCHNVLPTLQDTSQPPADPTSASLPPSLAELDASWILGKPVSPGVGRGIVFHVAKPVIPESVMGDSTNTPDFEFERLATALARLRVKLDSKQMATADETTRGVIAAHMAITDDVDLRSIMDQHLQRGHAAEQAVIQAMQSFVRNLQAVDNPYIRERAADVEDIGFQLLELLCGESLGDTTIGLRQPSVIVAERLTPNQLLSADRKLLQALVLEDTGATSHVVLMARSMNIPTISNMPGIRARLAAGMSIIVDAHRGIVIQDPSPAVISFYERECDNYQRRNALLKAQAFDKARTTDGTTIDVATNISFKEDVNSGLLALSDGIGLLRTELVFADFQIAPSEEQQYSLYCSAAQAVEGKPAIIRSYDVGADKPLAFFRSQPETNPALGCRGMRSYADNSELIDTQLRAIIRASSQGNVQLMIPMVSCLEEVIQVKERISHIKRELRSVGVRFNERMPVGVMVEVPLLVSALGDICPHVDFLSIGTNDLAQYYAAADRCNQVVASVANVRHPAFLRVLMQIVQAAREHKRWVGLCGDMASNARNLPLLLGLGLDEISVIGPETARTKALIGAHSAEACRTLLESAVSCKTVIEVEELLDGFAPLRRWASLLTPELVTIDANCRSRAEVIKHFADSLFICGRTENPDPVEKAIWDREQESTTGLGHGFAIPHCKTSAVGASSIAIVRLRQPIQWNSSDDSQVGCAILLAMNEADQDKTHMTVFSTLARNLMHEDFRTGLLAAPDTEALHKFVADKLAPAFIGD